MLVVMVILEKEGAVMQQRGVPSLPPFCSHDSWICLQLCPSK